MAIYDRQIKTAKRLISKYGVSVPVTNKRIVKNDLEPWKTTEVTETNTVKICFLPLDSGTLKTLSMIPGTEVPKGAVLAYMGAVTFDVDLTTTVVHEGKTWAMYYMDKLAPNGRPILYTMVLGS
jgi:hypothetical protein